MEPPAAAQRKDEEPGRFDAPGSFLLPTVLLCGHHDRRRACVEVHWRPVQRAVDRVSEDVGAIRLSTAMPPACVEEHLLLARKHDGTTDYRARRTLGRTTRGHRPVARVGLV